MAERTPLSRFWLPFRTLGRRPPSLPPTQPSAKPPTTRKSPSPSQKPPQPEPSPRAPSPALSPSPSRKSPEQESPSRGAIQSPSPSEAPSKPQPPSPEATPQPPLSRSISKRRQESPRTSRPPPSPTFSTKETQTKDQATPQEHEPKTSRSPSPSQSPKSSSQPLPPSPSPTFSAQETQTKAQAIPQEHEPKTSRPPSPSYSAQETQAQAHAIIPREHEPKTSRPPSPSQSPKSSPQPVSPKYEKQAQPAEEPKKDLEDLKPKPIPTDPIGKQTIPEIGVEETKAEKTDIKLVEIELPKPPQPDDEKEGNVEESKTKPEAKVETETRIEGVQEEEHKPKPETTMSEKLQMGTIQEGEERIDPKRLDPEPTVPHPDTSKLITKIRISKKKMRDDQDDAGGEEPRSNGSDGKESKIKISSIPRASPPTGEQTTFQAEIKEGISKLAEKLSIGHSELLGNGNGVMIVTLAGDNKGASMVIGYDSLTKDGSSHVHKEVEANKNSNKNRKEGSTDDRDEIPVISASVNSNVQSINNSLLHESSCSEENPGVHLVFSSKPTMPVKRNGKPETIDTVKTIPKTAQAQKLTYTPRVRRRCLRGLLLEPSESDQEDPQKPQRHGCRVSCDGKKNVKPDIEDAPTSIINWRNIP